MATTVKSAPSSSVILDENSDFSDETSESCDDSVIDKDYVPSDNEENILNSQNENSSNTETDIEDEEIPHKMRKHNDPTPKKTPKSRWRQRKPETYWRNKRKARRNLGQEYISDSTKKLRTARELGSPCQCKNKCREKLEQTHEMMFHKFWHLGSYDLQNRYLFGCINV